MKILDSIILYYRVPLLISLTKDQGGNLSDWLKAVMPGFTTEYTPFWDLAQDSLIHGRVEPPI